MPTRALKLEKRSVILYAINLIISGQVLLWSHGVQDGFWLFLSTFGVVALAFACVILSMSEISSCLPFSGGSFAFARVCAGPFVGFLVGACDRIDLAANSARSLFLVSYLITQAAGQPSVFIPICLIIQFTWIVLFYLGDKAVLFKCSSILAMYSMLLLTIFILSSLPNLHFKPLPTSLPISFDSIRDVLPLPVLFFNGVYVAQTATLELKDARRHMPMLLIGSFIVAFLLAVGLIFILASHAPYDYSDYYLIVLTSSMAKSLQMQSVIVLLLFVPLALGSFVSYFLALKRQMISMAQSNLLIGVLIPLGISDKNNHSTQMIVVVIGQCLIFMLVIFGWFIIGQNWLRFLTKLGILGGCSAQIGNLYSFIIFRWRYTTLNRKFMSPVGVPGAIFAAVILTLIFIAIISDGSTESLVVLALFLFALFVPVVVYVTRLQKVQTFSNEESSVMFALHVINYNRNRNSKYRSTSSSNSKLSYVQKLPQAAAETEEHIQLQLDPLQREVERSINIRNSLSNHIPTPPTSANDEVNSKRRGGGGGAIALMMKMKTPTEEARVTRADSATKQTMIIKTHVISEEFEPSEEPVMNNSMLLLPSALRSSSSDDAAQPPSKHHEETKHILHIRSPSFQDYFVAPRHFPRFQSKKEKGGGPLQTQQQPSQVLPILSLSDSLDDLPSYSIRRNAGWDQHDLHHDTMEQLNCNAFLEDVFGDHTDEVQTDEEENGANVTAAAAAGLVISNKNKAVKEDEFTPT